MLKTHIGVTGFKDIAVLAKNKRVALMESSLACVIVLFILLFYKNAIAQVRNFISVTPRTAISSSISWKLSEKRW